MRSIDDFDEFTSVDTFKEMTDGDDFKRLKKDELENIAKNKGARKNDAWDETTGRSNAGKDTDPTPDRNPNNFSDDEKTVFPDGSGDLKDKTKKLIVLEVLKLIAIGISLVGLSAVILISIK